MSATRKKRIRPTSQRTTTIQPSVPRWFRPLLWFLMVAMVAGLAVSGLWPRPGRTVVLRGNTMGTTYSIRLVDHRPSTDTRAIRDQVEAELKRVNAEMSTYDPESELSRFNQFTQLDEWFPVSDSLVTICRESQELSTLSDGQFDVTVGPLVNLWGFGTTGQILKAPSDAEVEETKSHVGFRKLETREKPAALKKMDAHLKVDLSAIAKGHGVDRVAEKLLSLGFKDYFVEIGGEIRTLGSRADGRDWQVGIETPTEDDRSVELTVGLSGRSMATSGDYRNLFVDSEDGTRYSHTIDPSTGKPARNDLASVTAVDDRCSWADGIATTMMAMGPEKGMKLAEEQAWEVLFLFRSTDGIIRQTSSHFDKKFPTAKIKISASNHRDGHPAP